LETGRNFEMATEAEVYAYYAEALAKAAAKQ